MHLLVGFILSCLKREWLTEGRSAFISMRSKGGGRLFPPERLLVSRVYDHDGLMIGYSAVAYGPSAGV